MLSGLRGESLVWTDLDRWRQRLLASPWVRDAALRRSLPSTVEVVVWERQPIGIGRLNDGMYLVDDRGAIIDQYGPRYADLDLPIVDGLSALCHRARTGGRCLAGGTGGPRHQRAQGRRGHRVAAVADRRRRSPRRAGDPERRRGGHLARRRPVSRAAPKLSRARAGAARSRGRRSITSTCGSRTGSTCGRRSGNPEAEWQEENDTWSGSTSAPRR